MSGHYMGHQMTNPFIIFIQERFEWSTLGHHTITSSGSAETSSSQSSSKAKQGRWGSRSCLCKCLCFGQFTAEPDKTYLNVYSRQNAVMPLRWKRTGVWWWSFLLMIWVSHRVVIPSHDLVSRMVIIPTHDLVSHIVIIPTHELVSRRVVIPTHDLVSHRVVIPTHVLGVSLGGHSQLHYKYNTE